MRSTQKAATAQSATQSRACNESHEKVERRDYELPDYTSVRYFHGPFSLRRIVSALDGTVNVNIYLFFLHRITIKGSMEFVVSGLLQSIFIRIEYTFFLGPIDLYYLRRSIEII